ncbi:MAG: glycine zipper 2TM domain-containing protein [Sphingomonas sp.]|nr:glycine zipper 2TM domain-containing protein [Sphingomonas sp.]
MRKILAQAALAVLIASPLAAQTQENDYSWNGDRDSDWDPARHYRHDDKQAREMVAEDRVYRGSDGRYYCKRSDGTTGLIIGAASGGILGNVIDGGHSRVAGTLIGGALGAIVGKSVDQNSSVRCR